MIIPAWVNRQVRIHQEAITANNAITVTTRCARRDYAAQGASVCTCGSDGAKGDIRPLVRKPWWACVSAG